MENGKKKWSSKKMIFAIVGGMIAVCCLCIVVVATVSPSTPSTPSPSALPATIQPEPIQVSSPVPTATEDRMSRCIPASIEQMNAIRPSIKDISPDNDILSGWVVEADEIEDVWYFAAKIHFAGGGVTEPGLWVISGEFNHPSIIFSINNIAANFSSYPASQKLADGAHNDDGSRDALFCASGEKAAPAETNQTEPTSDAKTNSTGKPTILSSLSDFENSQFCKIYECKAAESWELKSGGINHMYDTSLNPSASVEVTTLSGKPVDFGLVFYDRENLNSDDLQYIYLFLQAVQPGAQIDETAKDYINRGVENDVFQICQAESMQFGLLKIWAGKVIQQTIHVGENCRQ